MKTKQVLISALSAFILITGCKKKEDPVIPNEEELITTLTYTLISQDGTDTVVFRFQDLDGQGGNNPIITGGTLLTNTIYIGTIELLNEQVNPAQNITDEVKSESEAHQFFYNQSGIAATVSYNDADQNGNPIGIKTMVAAQSASTGTLTITLRHEPDKFATGVSAGDMTNAGGETDIEVTFDVDIQ